MKQQPYLLFGLGLMHISFTVSAVDLHVGGFGTASVSCFTDNTAQYVMNDQPEGPGHNRTCDGGTDSLLGVQLDLGLLESLEVGVQVVADRNVDRDYLPGVMVAQLRWHPTEDLTLRLGRMPTPVFLHSESRQVRYAMPWVRPPIEVYGLAPTFSHDGIEFIQEQRLSSWQFEWHGGLAHTEFDTPLSNSKDSAPVDTYGGFLNLSVENNSTLVKLGYLYNQTSFSSPSIVSLFDLLRTPAIPQGGALVKDLAIDESPLHLLSFGMRYEHDDWLLMSEFSFRSMEGFFRKQIGTYITLGRRFDDWFPYITLARRWSNGPNTDNRAGYLQAPVAALMLSSRYDTTSVALGVSRDINENIKLKFQTDWIKPDANSWGLYTNHASTFDYANPSQAWLFTLSLDFVF